MKTKSILSGFALSVILLTSCNGNKEKREAFIKDLIKQDSILLVKQSEIMGRSGLELQRMSDHILNMAAAGASKVELESLQNEKKKMEEGFLNQLKEIEKQQDINGEKLDSALKAK